MNSTQLKEAMQELGLSQQELSDLTMRGLRTVQYWCAGTHPVPPKVTEFLIELLQKKRENESCQV